MHGPVLWTSTTLFRLPIAPPSCGIRDDDPHDGDAPRYVIEQLELGRANGTAPAPRPPLPSTDLGALHVERLLRKHADDACSVCLLVRLYLNELMRPHATSLVLGTTFMRTSAL